jgi:hypothetical protein
MGIYIYVLLEYYLFLLYVDMYGAQHPQPTKLYSYNKRSEEKNRGLTTSIITPRICAKGMFLYASDFT